MQKAQVTGVGLKWGVGGGEGECSARTVNWELSDFAHDWEIDIYAVIFCI